MGTMFSSVMSPWMVESSLLRKACDGGCRSWLFDREYDESCECEPSGGVCLEVLGEVGVTLEGSSRLRALSCGS